MSAKILIIEDESMLREIYALKLSLEGFEVETAQDGAEGLKKASTQRPDLILLDMIMPRLTGLEFLVQYGQSNQVPTRILVLSNKTVPQEIDEAKRLGAREYLIKSSLTPDDIVTHVRRHLGTPPTGRPALT